MTADDDGVFLGDLDLTSLTQLRNLNVLQLQTQLGGNDLAAGQDGDILQHLLAAVAETGRLDGNAGEGSAQFVQNQRGQSLALDVLCDNQQLLAGLHQLLQKGQDFLNVGNLLVGNQNQRIINDGFHLVGIRHHVGGQVAAVKLHTLDDLGIGLGGLGLLDGNHAVSRDLLHCIGNQLTDDLITGGNSTDTGDILLAVDLLGIVDQRRDSGVHSLLHALTQNHGVRAGGHILHALADESLCQQGSGRGAVTGGIVCLGGDLLDQRGAHVFRLVLQLDLLGDGYAVIGNQGRAVLLVQHHVASLGTQGDLDGIRQFIYAAHQRVAGLNAIQNFFCHNRIHSFSVYTCE